MRKSLLALLTLVAINLATYGVPLSGTYYIPSGTPSYPTIADAFTALNGNGVDVGGATFLVAPGYTEAALNLVLSVSSANASSPIIFKRDPAGIGANPKILVSAGTASTTDGGIIIAGTDYVTFNQIDVDASAQTTIEWGYALVKARSTAPFDGCQHVTITGCTITLNKANISGTNCAAAGIYAGNHTATNTTLLAITSPSDACNNCCFDNNIISNVHIGVRLIGFVASVSTLNLYDHNNEVGKLGQNVITNFGSTTADCYGVYCAYQDSIAVMNNSIVSATGATKRMAGITMTSGTNSNAEMAFNTITVSSSGSGSTNLYGIWNNLGGPANLNCIKIHDNTILNCSFPTATNSPMYGILNTANADTVRIYNNTIYNSTYPGTSTAYVISSNTSATTQYICNNNIYNITNSGTAPLVLIYTGQSATVNLYSNNLHDCSTNGGLVTAINAVSGVTWNVYKNKIYNLSSAGTTGLVYGIANGTSAGGAATANIFNNFIFGLTAPASINNPAVNGIYALRTGTTNNMSYNTVYIDQPLAGSASFGSCALYAETGATTSLRNNILVNVSAHGAAGYTVAYRRTTNNLLTYSANSNNNDFFAGTPGPNNLIYYDGTTPFSTLPAYQALVTPRDGVSFTENPPFNNVLLSPYNLHMQSGVNTLCESGGQVISSPVNIIDDFDGDARYPNPGYPNNLFHPATAPDVGADEFAGGLVTPPIKLLNITVLLEGLYAGNGSLRTASDEFGFHFQGDTADLINVSLHKASDYSIIKYQATNVKLSTSGIAIVNVPGINQDWYYITINHRNSIETTTADSISFAASTINYNFDSPAKAYGNNMGISFDGAAFIFGGDAVPDGLIEGSDLSIIQNLANTADSGYLQEDVNGDGLIDGDDLSLAENNGSFAIGVITP